VTTVGIIVAANAVSFPAWPRIEWKWAVIAVSVAVVAYLEPIGRPEISRLRGVAADQTVASLVERGLLEEAGRPEGGGAMRYRTTPAFQERFGLRGPGDLPPLERFELTGPEAERVRERLLEGGHLGDRAPVAVSGDDG